ncbi:hypothetical protein HUU40_07460 [candidate division KSB1 bacterium]|nr:hypothetical protein [candidate division KSB1 bacterium]
MPVPICRAISPQVIRLIINDLIKVSSSEIHGGESLGGRKYRNYEENARAFSGQIIALA